MSDEEYIDQDNYQAKVGSGGKEKELTFKAILLEHIRRIAILSSQDFDEGGYIKKVSFFDQQNRIITTESYIPSKRKCFMNAVRFFRDLTLPFIIKKLQLKDTHVWIDNLEDINKAASKCIEYEDTFSKRMPTQEETNMMTEAYRTLFVETNKFCAYNNYFARAMITE